MSTATKKKKPNTLRIVRGPIEFRAADLPIADSTSTDSASSGSIGLGSASSGSKSGELSASQSGDPTGSGSANYEKMGEPSARRKSLRYGLRPDGRYFVHAGRHGVYFRRNGDEEQTPVRAGGRWRTQADESKQAIKYSQIESEAIDELEPEGPLLPDFLTTNSSELIRLIDESRRMPEIAGKLAIAAGLLAIAAALVHPLLAVVVALLGIPLFLTAKSWDQRRREIRLHYSFDQAGKSLIENLYVAFNQLAGCKKLWKRSGSDELIDNEALDESVASEFVERREVHAGAASLPNVVSDVPIPVFQLPRCKINLLPNGLLVDIADRLEFLSFHKLQLDSLQQHFIEDNRPPSDATIVEYAREDNRKLPVCLYGEVHLSTDSSVTSDLRHYLNCVIQTSQSEAASRFVDELSKLTNEEPLSQSQCHPWIEISQQRERSFFSYLLKAVRDAWFGGTEIYRRLIKRFSGGDPNTAIFLHVLLLGGLASFAAMTVYAFYVLASWFTW